MREIIFRGLVGKSKNQNSKNGVSKKQFWVYGGVYHAPGQYSIIYGGRNEKEIEKWAIPSDTLEQFAGIVDSESKNSDQVIEKWTVMSNTVGQFVGMVDSKSGKKIFEDDIVQVESANRFYDPGVVVWSFDKSTWCFVTPSGEAFPLTIGDKITVIGNIHENPDIMRDYKADEHVIHLEFPEKVFALSGYYVGKSVFYNQVLPKLLQKASDESTWNTFWNDLSMAQACTIKEKLTIEFPRAIEYVTTSFVHGFFEYWMDVMGLNDIKRWIEVKSENQTIPEYVWNHIS